MTVDLSGVSPQVKGFYNSGAGVACAQVAFKCLTLASDHPINDGNFRPLKVIVPPGTVVSAQHPSAMRVWMTYPMTVVDTIFKALAKAIPEKTIAGHHADLMIANVNGIHPRDGKLWIYLGGLIGGGWGAKHNHDGVNVTVCMNDGDTHNGPSEQVENKFPLLVKYYQLREGSGGAAGFAKGGAAVKLEADGEATILHYTVNAQIGGKLAQLGGRLIDATSKKLAGDFFEKFSSIVGPAPEGEEGEKKKGWIGKVFG
jgi:N-methylhydantoinase B